MEGLHTTKIAHLQRSCFFWGAAARDGLPAMIPQTKHRALFQSLHSATWTPSPACWAGSRCSRSSPGTLDIGTLRHTLLPLYMKRNLISWMKLRNSPKENTHWKSPGAPTGELHTSHTSNLDVTRCHD